MKCATCGNEVTYSGVFCEHCGAWVGKPHVATRPLRPEPDHTVMSHVRPDSEPDPPRSWVVVLLLMVLMLAAPVTSILNFATGHEFLGSMGLVMMVGTVALTMWQKWGLWLFIAGAAAYCVVAIVNGTYLHAACFALSVPVLFGILQIRKDGQSYWSQLR